MSAKKSASPKKAATKKTAVKKVAAKKAVASPVSKKTATTKGGKASKPPPEAAVKKKAAKVAPEPKASAVKTANKAAAKASDKSSKPSATELLKRTKHHTPAIFKTATRKQAPIVFTLEDVREILEDRKREEQEVKIQTTDGNEQKSENNRQIVDDVPIQNTRHSSASLADILGFNPASASPRQDAESRVQKKWLKYYRSLVELRDHLRNSLGMHANDTLKRSQKEDAGDISTSADAGTDNFDRDFALSLLSTEQEALKEVDAAIDRIMDGSYGVCEITAQKIAPERLEAVPFTRFSLEGQREFEKNQRRRVQRAGAFLTEGAADGVSFIEDDGDN
jgi:RNA polymerase-binding transcription factor DksA